MLVAQLCPTLLATPWTVAREAPLAGKNGSGLPFPSPGDLPDPVIESGFPPLQADSLLTEPPRNPQGDVSK